MSKAVKSVGRAVGKVFKGAKKAVSSAWKKVKENPILRTIAIGAAVYFTGGAALGAIGGAAGGGGIAGALSGAMKGIGSAWTGIAGAGKAAMAGNFSGAATALKGGLGIGAGATPGVVATGANKVGGLLGMKANTAGMTNALAPMKTAAGTPIPGTTDFMAAAKQSGAQLNSLGVPGTNAVNGLPPVKSSLLNSPLTEEVVKEAAAPGGILGFVQNNPLLAYGGLQMAGSALTGAAQQRQVEDDIERYRRNVGGAIPVYGYNPATGQYGA